MKQATALLAIAASRAGPSLAQEHGNDLVALVFGLLVRGRCAGTRSTPAKLHRCAGLVSVVPRPFLRSPNGKDVARSYRAQIAGGQSDQSCGLPGCTDELDFERLSAHFHYRAQIPSAEPVLRKVAAQDYGIEQFKGHSSPRPNCHESNPFLTALKKPYGQYGGRADRTLQIAGNGVFLAE